MPPPNVPVNGTLISGSPVPANGGNLYYAVFIENAESAPLGFQVWHDIEYMGGGQWTVVSRYVTRFPPGASIYRPDLFFPVPAQWPGGYYRSTICVGENANSVWNEDEFYWEKEGEVDLGFDFAAHLPTADFLDQSDIMTNESVIPDRFDVIDVYPNPFNTMATIKYALPQDTKVLLSIHDVNGRRVATLMDGFRNAGIHEVAFNASHLASGIYLYRLNAGSNTCNGKIVLMK